MGRRPARKGRGRKGRWRPAAIVLAAVAGLALLGVAAVAALVWVVQAGLPPVPTFDEYARSVPKVSRVLAADGTVVAEFFNERRTLTRPDAIPARVEKAFLAAEDAGFRKHGGLSFEGIARAMLVNLWRGRVSQGGSTITQQVAKQVLLGPERTWQRKFRELLLTRRIEQALDKDVILALYLSEVYLGAGRYGVEEAARWWFGKPARDLDLAEAALLAGLVSSPEANSPLRNPEGALSRRAYVLRRMAELGWVAEVEARAASEAPVRLWAREEGRPGAAPYFVDAVRREVTRLFGTGRLLHDGLTVRTTLDLRVQDAADAAVAHGLGRLWGAGRTREADEAAGGEDLSDGREDDGLPAAPAAVRARVVRCDRRAGTVEVDAGGQRALLEPASLARRVLGGHPDPWEVCRRDAGDLAVSRAPAEAGAADGALPRVNAEPGPQAALVVLDPATRAVQALVGGEDFATRPFNRAVQSRRPMGSTMKPFLYAAALGAGLPEDSVVSNTAVSFRGAGGRAWTPRNYEGGWDGRDYSLSEALARSVNTVAVKVLAQVGVGPLVDLLESVGIDGEIPRDLSLALGSAEASPLALANAMADLAAGGLHDTPYLVAAVLDHDGTPLLVHRARPARVLPARTARWVRDALRQAVLTGTAKAAADLPVPAWGKTGTTNRSREAWFAGSDGRRVVTVLVGYDDRLPMRGATGGNTAVPFFVDFVRMLGAR